MVVCPGTYHKQVVITKPVSRQGQRATVGEAGVAPAFSVTIPNVGTVTPVSDDTGPTHNNLAAGNVVTGNATDCGITVPGTTRTRSGAAGQPQPLVAGVYHNVIRGNVVTSNGVKGEGAGVLFADATAGTASYDNLVQGNCIAGNGLSGVTMHAQAGTGDQRLHERDHGDPGRSPNPGAMPRLYSNKDAKIGH